MFRDDFTLYSCSRVIIVSVKVMANSRNPNQGSKLQDANSKTVHFQAKDEMKQIDNTRKSLVDDNGDRVVRSPLEIDFTLLEFAGDGKDAKARRVKLVDKVAPKSMTQVVVTTFPPNGAVVSYSTTKKIGNLPSPIVAAIQGKAGLFLFLFLFFCPRPSRGIFELVFTRLAPLVQRV